MKRFKVIAVLAAVAALSFVLAGCSSETYTPPSKSPQVTKPAITSEGTLKVGVNTGNAPLAGKASKIVGIDVDIAAALASELGLKVEIIDVGTDGVKSLRNGTVDIVMGIDASGSETGLWKSDSYLETSVALFSKSATATVPTKEGNPTIAAQVSSMSSWAVTNEFGADALKAEADLGTVFQDLKDGKVDYAAADAVIGSYAATTIDLNASIIALMQQPSGYCIGVYDTNTELSSLIAGTLKKLEDNGIIDVVATKWLGAPLDLSGIPLTASAKAPAADPDAEAAEGGEGAEGEAGAAETDGEASAE